MKTNGHRRKTRQTRKRTTISSTFKQEIAIVFLQMLMMVKLFHWKTTSFATHKATDELYTKMNANIDSFVEILLGKSSGSRIDLTQQKHIQLLDFVSQDQLKQHIEQFKTFLVSLDSHPGMKSMSNTDLLNIRDTILGDLNQFLYLLTFK